MRPERAIVEAGVNGAAVAVDGCRARLYVAGATAQSAHAIEVVRDVCSDAVAGRYDLEIIDLYQLPRLGERDAIIATPTLVIATPDAPPRVVTVFADRELVRKALVDHDRIGLSE